MTDYIVSAGSSLSGITLNNGDTLSILSGGIATDITINSGGEEIIADGGVASGTVVNSGGIADDTYTFDTGIGNAFAGLTVNSGGTLELLNVHSGLSSAQSLDSSTDILSVTSGVQTVSSGSIQLTGTYPATSAFTVNIAPGNHTELTFTCFGGGTEILTDRGEVPVEQLHPGDTVVVRRDNQTVLEPVTWVGSSTVDLSRHAQTELAAPIRIKAGALAQNTPVRDLVVSPEHCLIIDGRCVPAKLLVNGGSIQREYRSEPFTYYHVELERHGILVAAGAETESYLDTGNRASFDNAGTPPLLHPTFAVNATSDRWKTEACAPLLSREAEAAPLWQALANRSVALGYPVPAPVTVTGPDLHILADGQRIAPVSDRDSRYVFTVPAGVTSVCLASRFCIPADKMVSNLRDTRRLGVSVNWIAIRSGGHETILAADHPSLRDGWNEVEQSGSTMWRWTNGAATIPWENIPGLAVVTVRCVPVDGYLVYDEKLSLVA